jgi:hypothetical protein
MGIFTSDANLISNLSHNINCIFLDWLLGKCNESFQEKVSDCDILKIITQLKVIAEAKHNTDDPTTTIRNSQIYYGLFDGKLTRNVNQGSDNYGLSSMWKINLNYLID